MTTDQQAHDALRALVREPVELAEDSLHSALATIRHTPQASSLLRNIDPLQPLIGATRFAVAAVVLALFGGFLLVGVMTEPRGDEMAPAAVTDHASLATTDELLSGMVTEEVEPGIYRVLDDGAGHGTSFLDVVKDVVVGRDGTVWLLAAGERRNGARLFQLGAPGAVDASRLHSYWPDVTLAPDGTLWALGSAATNWGDGGSDQLLSLRDGSWTRHDVPASVTVTGVEVGPDDTVWATWSVGIGQIENCLNGPEGGGLAVARLVDGLWQEEADGVISRAASGDGGSLAVGPDGKLWLGVSYHNVCQGDRWGGLSRLDAGRWMEVPIEGVSWDAAGPVAVGADGTVWTYVTKEGGGFGRGLARFSDDGPTIFDESDGVPVMVANQTYGADLAVSPDGRLWATFHDGDRPVAAAALHREWGIEGPFSVSDASCVGVLSFDGSSWARYLPEACASHVAMAPDGSVWVTVVRASSGTGLYVITPEAVAASE